MTVEVIVPIAILSVVMTGLVIIVVFGLIVKKTRKYFPWP